MKYQDAEKLKLKKQKFFTPDPNYSSQNTRYRHDEDEDKDDCDSDFDEFLTRSRKELDPDRRDRKKLYRKQRCERSTNRSHQLMNPLQEVFADQVVRDEDLCVS